MNVPSHFNVFIFLGTRLCISRKFYRPSAWAQFIHHQASPNLHMAFKSAPAGVRTVTLLRRLNMALGLCPTERTRSAARSTSTASGITNAKCRVDYLTTISIKDGIPPAKTTSEFQIQSPLLKLSKIQVVHLFFSIEGALGMQARQCSQCMPAKKERENRVHYRPRSTPHLKIQLPSL